MKLNQEQKDLLIGILENAFESLDMGEVMEFGDAINYLILQANQIKVEVLK